MSTILIADDEARIRRLVSDFLKRDGHTIVEAVDGKEALNILENRRPGLDMAILDVMMPGMDGFEVLRELREQEHGETHLPVMLLTARAEDADQVRGLEGGADDYVTKPFSVIELAARVDALYRRVSGSPFSEDDVIKSGPFKLNLRAREVLKNGVKIELTQIEYGLLKAFMQNIGKALSRDELLEMVWGHHYVGELKIVDVNIRRLRIKIEDSPADPTHIVTVRGYGYMWEG